MTEISHFMYANLAQKTQIKVLQIKEIPQILKATEKRKRDWEHKGRKQTMYSAVFGQRVKF